MSNFEQYDDYINDCYPSYKIGYLEFSASEILKTLDPIAYNQIILDLEDLFNSDNE